MSWRSVVVTKSAKLENLVSKIGYQTHDDKVSLIYALENLVSKIGYQTAMRPIRTSR